MHDYTLKNIYINWTAGNLELTVESSTERHLVKAKNLKCFSVTMEDYWGPSVSILETFGPQKLGSVNFFSITLQSGDSIRIEAVDIDIEKEILQAEEGSETVLERKKDGSDLIFAIEWDSKAFQCNGVLSLSCKTLARFSCTKEQPAMMSNDIKQISPELMINKSRRLQIIDTLSGDRIQIEDLI